MDHHQLVTLENLDVFRFFADLPNLTQASFVLFMKERNWWV